MSLTWIPRVLKTGNARAPEIVAPARARETVGWGAGGRAATVGGGWAATAGAGLGCCGEVLAGVFAGESAAGLSALNKLENHAPTPPDDRVGSLADSPAATRAAATGSAAAAGFVAVGCGAAK